MIVGTSSAWANDTYEQLTSIANIDESADYVLGIDGTGFHYEGTSSWGKTALPSAQTPIKYTLTKAQDGNSFTAKAIISGKTYYLQVPTSNTFSMATSTGTNTDLIIGTTQISGTNYAVANKSTTTRHLRINGTSGLRSYAGNTGTMAFFYKVVPSVPAYTISAQSNNESYGTVSLSGSVITGSPKSGYRYASPAYTVDPENSATVAQEGDLFTVTPSENTTVTINFEAIPTHTAHFSVNGTINNENDCSVIEGSDITFPSDPTDINGKKFMGWVAAPIDGTTDEKPSFVTSATMSTSDVTFYAVFAAVTPGTAQDASMIIDANTTNVPDSYAAAKDYTLNGVVFNITQMYKNGTKLQWRAEGNSNGTGTMYNTEALQNIQSVVLTYDASDSNKNFTLKVGNEKNPTDGTAITPTNSENVYTFDCSSYNKDYFVLTNGTNAGYLTSIVISYQTGAPDTYSAYCTSVGAAVAVTGVTLDETSKILFVGDEFDLTATVAPDNATVKNVTWTSSDETKATVINGHVTAIAAGTPTITVTTTDGNFTATCELTISNVAVTGVTLDQTSATIYTGSIGNTVQLTPTIAPANATNKAVSWESSDEDVATVDENGLVTAVAIGTATITVTTTDGSKTATCDITVETAPGSAEKPYTIAQAKAAIDAETSTTDVYVKGIVSQVDSYDGTKYITYWISEDGTTTDQFEVYKGLGISGASFSAETDVKVGDKVVVKGNIKKYYSTYEFDKDNQLVSIETLNFAFGADSYEVENGGDLTITASSNNSSGAITYSSSATDIAEINAETGVVTAKKEGETTITATIAAADGFPGKSINVTLTVTDSREAATISFANAEVFALDADGTYIQAATVAQGDYNGTISYTIETSTSDGALIDDATGELLFDKKGTIVVKATAGETATYKSNTAIYTLKVRTTPTIDVADKSIVYGETYTYDAASNVEGGAVTMTSGNTSVATVAEYVLTGVAVGSSTITVATDANDEYIEGSKTFVLTVTAPEGKTTATVLGTTTTFKNKDLGYDGDGMDWEASASANSFESSNNARGVQFGAAIGNFFLTSSANNVTKVSMVLSTNGSGNKISVSVGENSFTTTYGGIDETSSLTLTSGMSNATVEFTGSGSGIITISVTDDNKSVYFKSITVTSEITVTLNGSGYATYCSQYPLDFSKENAEDKGFTAWQITDIDGSTITFSQVTGKIKGGQGILLKGIAGATVALTSDDSDTELSDNLLEGTTAPTYVDSEEYFGLSGNKFVKVNAGTIRAGKALLPASAIPASARELTFVFEDETTGISEECRVKSEEFATAIYDLQGRKVSQPKKGLYIMDGKKVMIK